MINWIKHLFGSQANEQVPYASASYSILQQAEIERAEEELKILHADFAVALDFFKTKYKDNYNLPLFLVIGQSSFGKTTLLAKSGLNLQDVYGSQVHNEFSTKYCTWLFSSKAVFLDTAGVYTVRDKEDPHANLVWLGLLRILQGRFLQNPISGVIVVIDVPTLMEGKSALSKTLNDVRERLYELARYVEKLPVFIAFTKADLIDGFKDFFADLSLDEQKQPFGMTFVNSNGDVGNGVNPQAAFTDSFFRLTQALEQRLWKNFSKEDDLFKRRKMQNFVAQIFALRPAIIEVLNEMPHGGHIELHGIYFVSSLQQGAPRDCFKEQLLRDLLVSQDYNSHLPQVGMHKPISANLGEKKNHAYFTENLFSKIILAKKYDAAVAKVKELSWSQLAVTLGMCLFLGVASLLWYKSYSKSIDAFSMTTNILEDRAQPDDALKLERAIGFLNNSSSSWWTHMGLPQINRFSAKLNKYYSGKFGEDFVMQIAKTLEEEITITETAEYKYLYNTLKAYIMLSDPAKLDIDFVENWFMQYWQRKYVNDVAMQKHLADELDIVLHQGIKITKAEQIIAAAREVLNSHNVPKEDLVYSALEKAYAGQKLKFKFTANFVEKESKGNEKNDKGIVEIEIPKLYTAENFDKVYQKQIPEIAYALSRKNGDWVLNGNDAVPVMMPHNEMDKLINNLRALYIKQYADVWSDAAQQIKIADIDNLKELQHFLVEVTHSNYPLLPFLKMMQINLSVNHAPAEFIMAVNNALAGFREVNLKSLYEGINNLALYLGAINTNADVAKASFVAASTRFNAPDGSDNAVTALRKLAAAQPQLVKGWLQNIADNSWQLILNNAENYIGTMWSTNVFPEYKALIENNYPFFKDGQKSIALDDLAKFFAAGGVMDNFFNVYLRPFVDVDEVYWTWKNVDGQHLNIGQDKLEVFIRAALIRKMFYPHGGTVPEVRFSLMAQTLTPNTERVDLNLGGQVTSSIKGQRSTAHDLIWPGSDASLVSIEFLNGQGKVSSTTMPKDAWAWFKLLDKANVQAIEGTQRFGFLIDLNGNAAKYELNAAQPINPFIPEIINNFRCPDKL